MCVRFPGEIRLKLAMTNPISNVVGYSAKELAAAVGGLSTPSKMPCLSYGLPAAECKLGSFLRKVLGSTCSKCFAHKGMYGFPAVQKAQYRRLEALRADLDLWKTSMARLLQLKLKGEHEVFRWHDSGDLQGEDHLEAIVWIAKQLPHVRFWLPTRERGMVSVWLKANKAFPSNLTVRISAAMIGEMPLFPEGTVGSAVGLEGPGVFQCPAPQQGNKCGSCRSCWSKTSVVSYTEH